MKKTHKFDWHGTLVGPDATIQDAIQVLNKMAFKIVLIVGSRGKLLGTVSDGDVRRGLLRGLQLKDPVTSISRKNPLVVSPAVDDSTVRELMRMNSIFQIPIIDNHKLLKGLHFWDQVSGQGFRKNVFVIMAGGRGKRMMPYTRACPKPMLPVGGRPMLEHILVRAREEGFRKFFICIHYLGEKVEGYFGDGRKWDVEIHYIREKIPLGTAGAVGLLPGNCVDPVVVTNGDVLTEVKYGEVLDFHEKHQGFATMAVQFYRWEHPFGVVHLDGVEIDKIEEKPLSQSHVNAGIYVLSPGAIRALPRNRAIHMPDFFLSLKVRKKRLLAYPLHEPWLDVGRPQDLLQAGRRRSGKRK